MDVRHPRLVSIVIPACNSGSFLHEAIQSVLSQTYQHTEIIVVDDGSSDNTAEVAASYPAVRLVRQQNQGVSAARNVGLRESNGDYLVFLDADDRLLPQALEIGVSCLNGQPECAFASGQVRLAAKDGSALTIPDASCIEKDHYLALLQYCYIWTPSAVMFRSSAIKLVGGFAMGLNGAADWDLYLRITRRSPVVSHGRLVVEYRVHQDSMSANPSLMLMECLAALRAQRICFNGNRDYEQAYRIGIKGVQKYYGEPLCERVKSHARASEWGDALHDVLVLLRYYPGGLLRVWTSRYDHAFKFGALARSWVTRRPLRKIAEHQLTAEYRTGWRDRQRFR
jgi:glycosyltransferase involved in cell wall biosynthesis